MRKLILVVASFAFFGCSPQTYVCTLDMRHPSPCGMDLAGKSVAVVYPHSDDFRDSLFLNCFADGLTKGLEKEYSDGEESVDVYSLPYGEDSDFSNREVVLDMVMKTGADVVLMLSRPEFGEVISEKMTGSVRLCAYDSMDARDTLLTVPASSRMYWNPVGETIFASDAQYMGLSASKNFINVWKTESYSIIYYLAVSENWENSLQAVEMLDWRKAVEIWMGMLDNSTVDRVTSLEYDIAVGCYMLGEYELALEWLDASDKTLPVSLSPALRKRINSRLDR